MKHLYLKKIEGKITISNLPSPLFKKEGKLLSPSFLKGDVGGLLKIIYLCLIMFLILPFVGCKKEQANVIKPMAEKVKTEEVKKDTKEAEETRKVEKEEYLYDQ